METPDPLAWTDGLTLEGIVEEIDNPTQWARSIEIDTQGASANIAEIDFNTKSVTYLREADFCRKGPKRLVFAARKIGKVRTVVKPGHHSDPTTFDEVLSSPDVEKWLEAIDKELGGLKENKTYVVSDIPMGRKAIPSKLIFKVKCNAENEIIKFKARVVVQGFRQKPGVDYGEKYAPVANAAVVRLALAIGAYLDLEINHINFTQAFLQAPMTDELYVSPPRGTPQLPPGKAWRLARALYGTIQAPKAWSDKVTKSILDYGFCAAGNEGSLFKCEARRRFLHHACPLRGRPAYISQWQT